MKISYHGLSTSLAFENTKMVFRLIVSVCVPQARYRKHFHCYASSLTISNVARFLGFINVSRHRDIASIFSYKYKPFICEIPAHKLVYFLLLLACLFPDHFKKFL